MAYKNKLISNSKTGQDILFLQTSKDTDGVLLEMQSTYNANSTEPAAHFHPYQEEDFQIIEGELTVRINAEVKIYKAGDTVHVEKGKVHSMWNSSDSRTIINWRVRPAMNTEYLLETMYGIVKDGKTNDKGMPGILQLALIANKYADVIRLAKPAFMIQKIIFGVLSPIAWISGIRPNYRKHLD